MLLNDQFVTHHIIAKHVILHKHVTALKAVGLRRSLSPMDILPAQRRSVRLTESGGCG